MEPRRAAALGALLGAVAGFGAGAAWTSRDAAREARGDAAGVPAPEGSTATAPDAAQRAERARLEDEVARLTRALSEQEAVVAEREAVDAEGEAAPGDPEQEALAARLAALEAAGWLPADVERLRAAFDAYELERLYLRDQATREGWRGSARFQREQRALLDDLHAELGDDAYDAALYAEGRHNRAMVLSMLPDSPAEAAGVRVGDEILQYAGERIFEPIPLVRLTVAGEAGTPVELRVLRNGEEIRLFVPRGPLGVRLRPVSRPPFRRP